MNEAVRVAADQTFNDREGSEPMLNPIEGAIHAQDPCSGCATHTLRALPLQLELLDADAAVRAGATR